MRQADDGSQAAVGAELHGCWTILQEAMTLGDVEGLDRLLADDFTLTHMTGQQQSKREWLSDMDADRMRYDAIELVEIAVAAVGAAPVVTVRTETEATIFGYSGSWRLQLRTVYRADDGAWSATSMVATTW